MISLGRRRRERPIPKHPYKDTAVLYAVLAALVVLAAGVTGGDLARAAVAAVAFFFVATAWSWWRFSVLIRERDEAAQQPEDDAGTDGDRRGNGGGS